LMFTTLDYVHLVLFRSLAVACDACDACCPSCYLNKPNSINVATFVYSLLRWPWRKHWVLEWRLASIGTVGLPNVNIELLRLAIGDFGDYGYWVHCPSSCYYSDICATKRSTLLSLTLFASQLNTILRSLNWSTLHRSNSTQVVDDYLAYKLLKGHRPSIHYKKLQLDSWRYNNVSIMCTHIKIIMPCRCEPNPIRLTVSIRSVVTCSGRTVHSIQCYQ